MLANVHTLQAFGQGCEAGHTCSTATAPLGCWGHRIGSLGCCLLGSFNLVLLSTPRVHQGVFGVPLDRPDDDGGQEGVGPLAKLQTQAQLSKVDLTLHCCVVSHWYTSCRGAIRKLQTPTQLNKADVASERCVIVHWAMSCRNASCSRHASSRLQDVTHYNRPPNW